MHLGDAYSTQSTNLALESAESRAEKHKYRGMFEPQKSGNKTSSGEILHKALCLAILTFRDI